MKLKPTLMRLSVKIAEWAGWLTIVDQRIIDSYFAIKKSDVPYVFQKLAEKFDNVEFGRTVGCFVKPWCVEVACKDGIVAVRNSSDDKQTTVFFTMEEWQVFIDGVKKGEFDFSEDD